MAPLLQCSRVKRYLLPPYCLFGVWGHTKDARLSNVLGLESQGLNLLVQSKIPTNCVTTPAQTAGAYFLVLNFLFEGLKFSKHYEQSSESFFTKEKTFRIMCMVDRFNHLNLFWAKLKKKDKVSILESSL